MRRSGNTVVYTGQELKEMAGRGESRTDWERVLSMTDEEIEANVDEEDEGIPDFSKIYIGVPGITSQLLVQYDQEVIDWFLAQGSDYPRLMNQALREYMQRHAAKATAAD
jgi:uncharacterized protein (DUF4415 family)